MKPLRVHGSSLACLVAVDAARRNGREVEWEFSLPVAAPFGQFPPFGMVLLELDHEDAPGDEEDCPPLADYEPGTRGHVPYLPMIREWAFSHGGDMVHEVETAPEVFWKGRYIDDCFLTPVGWTDEMRQSFAEKIRPNGLDGVPPKLYRRLWVPAGQPKEEVLRPVYRGMDAVMISLWEDNFPRESVPVDPMTADIVSPMMAWQPKRLPITASLMSVEEPALDISVVHIPDPHIPAHRVTHYPVGPLHFYSVEHEPGADPTWILDRLGIVEEGSKVERIGKATREIVDPTGKSERLWWAARQRIDLPGIIVGPCAAFGAESFNEQVIQGLAAEEATR